MDNLSLFAESIKELMLERNINPDTLHKATKISLNVIYAWLRKQSMPSVDSLIILADYFDCSIDYLCGRSEDANITKRSNTSTFPQRFRMFLSERDITRRKLSAETNISMCGIHRFLSNTGKPLLDNLIKLANYFDCSVDYLLGRCD